MSAPILATKLYIPPPRPKVVLRQRLIERLNEGMHCKLTLISASAGFGKTTLVSEWAAALTPAPVPPGEGPEVRVAWLSLDEGDNDPSSFLTYLVAALQTVAVNIGAGLMGALQSPQPPSAESILATLLNEITSLPDHIILVLDDYHILDSKPVDQALTFLLEHLPPRLHLVIASREDPALPLARLRARGQLTELRAADLRFTPAEAAEFLNQVMGLNLTAEDVAALDKRTEGWIAGLQLAAISMQGQKDAAGFIKAFTGSHHFVLDYLMEEVLQQQSETIQAFLLRTSILERLCGPQCEALLLAPSGSGQATLEYLEHANLFIVPLDNERRWYRYHHLFADLLRQRLGQSLTPPEIAELHRRASQWYEDNALDIEAFQHAAAANDIERAERLIDEKGLQTNVRGAAVILDWLRSLPAAVMDARPSLWMKHASVLLVGGQMAGVEELLQSAEKALEKKAGRNLEDAELNDQTRDLIGQIAAARAMLALNAYQTDAMFIQAQRALEYLRPGNLPARFRANLTLVNVHLFRGDRASAGRAIAEALAVARASGNILHTSVAMMGLGQSQELENQLYQAADNFRRSIQLLGDQLPPAISDAYLGLARISYEWNDLEAAGQHGQKGLQLARQYDRGIDISLICEVFLARLKLARGELAEAAAMLAETEQSARQKNFMQRMPEITAAQVIVLIQQGDLAAAAQLVQQYELPLCQARVLLARGDPSAALALLVPFRQRVEAKGWADQRLRAIVLQALALQAHGQKEPALQALSEVLALAEPGGFIRLFLDEGVPMAQLLSEAVAQGIRPDYARKLLAAFETVTKGEQPTTAPSLLVEPLSQRELEILRLIAQGLSNQEIGKRLFLALDTVKGHNRRIFDKLQVQRRTEAIARALELGLL